MHVLIQSSVFEIGNSMPNISSNYRPIILVSLSWHDVLLAITMNCPIEKNKELYNLIQF